MGRQQTDDASSIRDRIKGLVRVRAADLVPHPDNWREHPDGQRAALQGALAEIGWADAVLAREPVLVLDVTEEEAITLLLTLDPLAGLAKTNAEMVYQLLDRVEIDNANLRALAESIAPPRVADGETDPDADVDPVYVDVAVHRWEEFTGRKAERE